MTVLSHTVYSPSITDLTSDEVRAFVSKATRRKNSCPPLSNQRFVFELYRDVWFVQRRWLEVHGRYFQGLPVMLQIPKHTANAKLEHVSPTDQVDGWRDIGLTQVDAPVQFWCDMYIGPSGHGYTVVCCISVDGTIWANQMHYGPESYRGGGDYCWKGRSIKGKLEGNLSHGKLRENPAGFSQI